MDVMLQRHGAKFIYAVPDGLRELMSDISREVLRSQPVEIYTFIADYLDALMITRENARIAARFVETISEVATTIANFLEYTGMSRDEANKTACIIQTAFRKYLATKPHALAQEQIGEEKFLTQILDSLGIPREKAEEAALVIQNAYRQFKEKQEKQKELLKGMVDWRIAARSAIYLYKKTGVTREEANRAATLIKAAYKGYYTRRIMRRLLEEAQLEEIESESEEEWYDEIPEGMLEEEPYEALEVSPEEKIPEIEEEVPEPSATHVTGSIMDFILKIVVPLSVQVDEDTVGPSFVEAEESTGMPSTVEVEGSMVIPSNVQGEETRIEETEDPSPDVGDAPPPSPQNASDKVTETKDTTDEEQGEGEYTDTERTEVTETTEG